MNIYKFNPIYKSTLWGGERIAPFKGAEGLPAQVGESWELSAVGGNESTVADGPDAGLSLPQLIEKHKEALVGKKCWEENGTSFPLLIKFIDAAQDLSIQVHPDDQLAKKRHNSLGKTEMWYVVDAAPGATLLSGLKERISPEEYKKSVEDNTIADRLCRYDVNAGDCFFLPAGRIHSIGAGSFVAEIQETSDITYRIYDFNRRDAQGNTRELHTELAAGAIDYSVEDDYRTHYPDRADEPVLLVKSPYFVTSLLKPTKTDELDVAAIDSFVIVMLCSGAATIKADGDEREAKRGDTLLISADTRKLAFTPTAEDTQILICHL